VSNTDRFEHESGKRRGIMLKRIKKICAVVLAVTLISVAVNMFMAPHYIAAGGFTGLAIIFETMFSIDRSITIFVANGIILVCTLIFLGKEIFLSTVLGAALLPLIISLVPQVKLVENPMLSMVAGSVIIAVAASIMYANRASSGGTTVPPLISRSISD